MTCPDCNSSLTTDVEEGWWDVLRSYPDMDHCAELRHSCGAMQTVTVEQFRGHEPIRCGCGFAGKINLDK